MDSVFLFAEREGFEPPVPRGTTVFKTAAFDHSAISPNTSVCISLNAGANIYILQEEPTYTAQKLPIF